MDESQNGTPVTSQPANGTAPIENITAQPGILVQPDTPATVTAIISSGDAPKKKSGWRIVAKILGIMALTVLFLPVVCVFLVFVELALLDLEPSYNINVTKENWAKAIDGLPEHFNFTIVDEDVENGLLRIKYKKEVFSYYCKNERYGWGGLSKTFRCTYDFGEGREVSWYEDFPKVLWFLNEQEVLRAAKRVDGVEKIDGKLATFIVKDDEALLAFFDELMLIDDYYAFYTYAYENYEAPVAHCFGENGEPPMRNKRQ